MTSRHGLTLTAVTLSSPQPLSLARFYADLLGWTITVESDSWVELPNPEGGVGLSFHIEDEYQPPVWPSRPGEQIMQLHLEIRVNHLEEASAHALQCGATLAPVQPQEEVLVHFDPDGHPFCLYL